MVELAQQREPEINVPTLESLETCPIHGEKIEFYEEEESLDQSQEFEFASVIYGC